MWAFLLPILKAMGVGAAMGAGTSAVSGGSPAQGALHGAVGGAATGGLGGLVGGAGAGASAAATPAAKAGFSELLKKSAIDAGMNAAVGAATPQFGMTSVGQLPQMQSEDPMAQLLTLMHNRGGLS